MDGLQGRRRWTGWIGLPRRIAVAVLPCLTASVIGCGGGGTGEPRDVAEPHDAVDSLDLAADAAPEASLAVAFPADFRFGAATAAHQIEGNQQNSWTQFETLPAFAGKTREPSGIAVDHYRRYAEDLDHAAWMGLDVFRMSVEWSRVEPARGRFDETAISHYRDVLLAARQRGIRPSVTLHHFTDPVWFANLSRMAEPFNDTFCASGPSDEDFCWWTNPDSPAVFAEYCARMAEEYGDLVDEWWTFNEAQGYWFAATVTGEFPPSLSVDLFSFRPEDLERFAWPVMRNMLSAHAACYRAIHERDRTDADEDGRAARVGVTVGAGIVRPADPDREEDVAAAAQAQWVAAFQFTDPLATGGLDTDFDAEPDESHPEWAGTLDLYGLQYYFSTVVVGFRINPMIRGVPCLATGDALLDGLLIENGCPPPPTPDFPFYDPPDTPVFGRQHDPEGLWEMLRLVHGRYPAVPIVITENGFANDDRKRAFSIVRHLKACADAIADGVPLEGYYHWSLLDNFEWGEGFRIRFGLMRVDYEHDLARSPTQAAHLYRAITGARGLTREIWETYGGTGPIPAGPGSRPARTAGTG